jgi:hypothetical protein
MKKKVKKEQQKVLLQPKALLLQQAHKRLFKSLF